VHNVNPELDGEHFAGDRIFRVSRHAVWRALHGAQSRATATDHVHGFAAGRRDVSYVVTDVNANLVESVTTPEVAATIPQP